MIFKRIIKLFIIITISIFTTQAVYANDVIKKESIVVQAFDTDNVFTIDYGSEGISQSQAINYLNEAKVITLKLSDLSDNFYPSKEHINVYHINKNPETKLEIDKMLYDLLVLSEQYRIKTDGYFNIAMGEIIDGWKKLLNTSEKDISESDYNKRVREIKSIPIVENGIELTNENGKYYVYIKQGVKIDLGGIAKGYGVELVDRFFKTKKLSYYSLSGSESSLKYGKNAAREGDYFHIGINHPYITTLYGYVRVKNISLTTSGDTFQKNTLYGRFVHHIVSPKTREPENNYRSISLLTDDAGYGDVLSTAMFSMDEETLKSWAKKNEIEFIAIKYDGEVINQLGNTELVILNDKIDKKPDVNLYASEYEISKEYKKDQQVKIDILLNDLKQIISYEIIESSLTKGDRKEVEELLETYINKKTKINTLKISKSVEITNYVNSMLLDLNEYTSNRHNDSKLDSGINFVRHYFKKTDIEDKKRGPNAALIEWTAVGLTIVALGVAFYFMGRKKPVKTKEEE